MCNAIARFIWIVVQCRRDEGAVMSGLPVHRMYADTTAPLLSTLPRMPIVFAGFRPSHGKMCQRIGAEAPGEFYRIEITSEAFRPVPEGERGWSAWLQ